MPDNSLRSASNDGPPFSPLASNRCGASGLCSSASGGQHPIALFQSVKSRNHCGDFQKHPRRVNIWQPGIERPNLPFESINGQESKVRESFHLQFLLRRPRFSVRSCDNLPGALPRYGWIQGFSNERKGNSGRPNMERLSHLPNSLDGLGVAFLSHFFTFSWCQPGVKGQIFAMREIRLSKSIGCPNPSSASVNRPVRSPPLVHCNVAMKGCAAGASSGRPVARRAVLPRS